MVAAAILGVVAAIWPARRAARMDVLRASPQTEAAGHGGLAALHARGQPATVSTAGLLHVITGAIGFACLVAACFVLAHRFARRGRAGWAWCSRATGLVFLAGFVGIASGSSSPPVVLGFWFAVVVAWAWLAALCVHLYRATPRPDRPRAAGDDDWRL